jgi:site-specific recombinase XerD
MNGKTKEKNETEDGVKTGERGKSMTNKIITNIINDLASSLLPEQIAVVQMALINCLKNIEIKELAFDGKITDNSNLLFMFISAKRLEGCSEKTLAYYNDTIRKLLESVDKAIIEFKTDDVRFYLAKFQEERGSSKVTINNMRRIFNSFFAWLENEDYILKSPMRRIHNIRTGKMIKETMNDEMIEKLRDVCANRRDRAMIEMLISTGMRVGEIVLLNRDDINFHERECVVFGKGKKERTVYFDARTKIHLREYLDSRMDDNPALFVSLAQPYKRLLISGVETRLREIGKRADIQKVHPHKFRRTMATMAIDKGMPIEQVQRLLGHEMIETTMHYAQVNQVNVKNAHKKFIG